MGNKKDKRAYIYPDGAVVVSDKKWAGAVDIGGNQPIMEVDPAKENKKLKKEVKDQKVRDDIMKHIR